MRPRLISETRKVGGFTLIEAVMSILIVGLMLVAALNTIGASKLSKMRNAEQTVGPMLAKQLMDEIVDQPYAEDLYTFGLETGEVASSRANWDDVDDYHGWLGDPPQDKDGTPVDGADGYQRSVSVVYADPSNLNQTSATANGMKRIDVKVLHHGRPVATMSALRTYGWPESADEAEADLTTVRVLFVVRNPGALTTGESDRKALMESWGNVVTLFDDSESQANFDAAILDVDVAYVSPNISGGALAHKLTGKAIGIVSEFPGKMDNFGLSSSTSATVYANGFSKTNAQHFITGPFGAASVNVVPASYAMPVPGGTMAPDLQPMALASESPALVALDTGGTRYDNTPAPARRVHLPYSGADVSHLSDDGKTLMQRSIAWASEIETAADVSATDDTKTSDLDSIWSNLFQ